MYDKYKFDLKPLDYGINSLRPHISGRTMEFHYGKHLKAYVDNLNKALEPYPEYQSWLLIRLLYNIDNLPQKLQVSVRNNGGGVYNHNLYFELMCKKSGIPDVQLSAAIKRDFGTSEEMMDKLKTKAMSVFGSGYGWLVTDKKGGLIITQTANQDTLIRENLHPVLVVDVWEHAYYLDYQNRRGDYLNNWAEIINWEAASKLYEMRKFVDYSKI